MPALKNLLRLPVSKTLLTAAALAAWPVLHAPAVHAATTWNITPSSACTLADAITANDNGTASGNCGAGGGNGTIVLAAGTYTLHNDLPLIGGRPLTIIGAGPGITTIDGQNLYSVFYSLNTATVSIANLTITHAGGGRQFAAGLYGLDSSIQNVVIRDSSTVGGIAMSSGAGNVSTVKNVAVVSVHDAAGGGFTANVIGGVINISNTTLYNDGRGVWISGNGGGTVNITNSTIAGNNSGNEPAGVGVQRISPGTTVSLKNTILYDNNENGVSADCGTSGSVTLGTLALPTSAGHNIISDSTCNFPSATNYNATDPRLGALTFVSGTYVMPIDSSSPAFDNADLTGAPNSDQRGVSRPQCNGVDIGAYEVTGCSAGQGGSPGTGTGTGNTYNGPAGGSYGNGVGGYSTGPDDGNGVNTPVGTGISSTLAAARSNKLQTVERLANNVALWVGVIIAVVIFTALLAGRGGFWAGQHRKLINNRTRKLRRRLHKLRLKFRRYFALP